MSPGASYREFFPHYVQLHSKPETRWMHFAGTHLGALAAAVALVRRRPAAALAFPVLAYGLAGFSHLVIERNRATTFRHPLWSARANLQVMAMMWQGRDDELTRIARDQGMIVIDGGRETAA